MTDLRRHIPPVALTWDEEVPGALWREVDGTLVFADVSGFTALTERLSRRGRIGAEEIVETLNGVFGPMLHLAAARGGELLKFGGDALLFLFRGPDHAEQACDAAVEMRASLRRAARAPTSVGRLTLSMSVGLHAGPVHLFLVGHPTRELLVLGPAATATAQAERLADAGQVVVSPQSAVRLAPGALRVGDDGRLLLRRRVPRTSAPGPGDLPAVGQRLLASLFPRELGEYLAPGPPDPEHRLACIGFVRFSGTDALLASGGPDALAEALHRTVTAAEAALAAEGVTLLATDLDADGGKLFLGSGLPWASEDDEGRMLRAMRRLLDDPLPLPLQVGVNRGHVFATEVGVARRAAYTGMGDTTNTAARITARAPAGALFAHPSVLEHSRTRFEVTPAGPFPMKGKAAPVLVYEVGEELGTRAAAPADTRLPLLGRDAEQRALCATMAGALAGAGGAVTVVGATGVGKSRLVQQALAEVAADHMLVLRGEPYGAASAYRLFRDPIREILAIRRDAPAVMGGQMLEELRRLAPELVPMAPLLADVVAVEVPGTPEADQLDPQYRPDRLAAALITVLARARPGRLAIVVEEAHWADAASARLLARLAGAAAGRPWVVVAVRRGDAGGFDPEGAARVALGPLPGEVVRELVLAATRATPLRPHEVAALVERAEGNPLYVAQLARAAAGSGSLGTMPESLAAAVAAQIDQLPAHARRILRCASVLGRSFRVSLLRAVLRADGQVATDTDLAALSAFLAPDGPDRMRFRASVVRDAAYEGTAFRARATMHALAGRSIERASADLGADATMLALHFGAAGDAERTWRYARLAGEQARRAHATVDAAAMVERALESGRRVPGVSDEDLAELWALLGDLRELSGHLASSEAAYRRAEVLLADPVARAQVMARRARVLSRSGAPGRSVRVVGRARRLLAGLDNAQARTVSVRLDLQMAVARLGQDKPAQGRDWAARAAGSARELEDWHTLIRALLARDFADQQLGRPGVGRATREALDICMATGDLPQESVARANLGVLAFYAGRWAEAIEWLTTSSRVAIASGNDYGAAETDLSYADILIHQGRLDEAERVLSEASQVLRASGIDAYAAHALMLQARIRLARGDAAAAAGLAARSAAESTQAGSAVDAYEAAIVQAEATTDLGRSDEALALLDAAQQAAHGEGAALEARSQLARARAWLALGEDARTGAAIAAGLAAAGELDLPYERAMLLRLRSRWARSRRVADEGGLAGEAGPVGGAGGSDDLQAARILAELGAAG
jgi:class 3 adenylate cyclase/tetratricopeptide (TPR) repeat protein